MSKITSALGWSIGLLLPVKNNKIVITSYYGKGYSDSPKAIAEKLNENGKYDIVWLTDSECELPDGIKKAKYSGFSRIYHLTTAKIWIDNCRKGAKYKKHGQIYMQTWHGFALKQIEKDVVDKIPDPNYEEYAKRDSDQIDVIVSDSEHMTSVYKNSFWYNGEIIEVGSPRNDIFYSKDNFKDKVCKVLGIDTNKKLVLYAPTFRVNQSLEPYNVDSERICKALSERFGGDWVFLLRLHPNVAKKSSELKYKMACDATAYDDIQELLCASDCVISDYSSLIFDFALTEKPAFQYCVDIEEYKNDRNFYISLDEMPFGIAENNDQLENIILNFDIDKYKSSLIEFFDKYGIVRSGNASDKCLKWLEDKLHGGII